MERTYRGRDGRVGRRAGAALSNRSWGSTGGRKNKDGREEEAPEMADAAQRK